MKDETRDQLADLGVQLAITVLIPWLTHLVEHAIAPPLAFSDADVIVRGLDYSHPDWPGERKAEYARRALAHLLHSRGGWPTAADVNQMIEVAVQKAKYAAPDGPAPQP